LAVGDLTAARVAEAHTDALAILGEAATDPAAGEVPVTEIGATDDSTWGVFAAEGPGVKVTARADGSRWFLTGIKPWCSLAGSLSHALITAHTPGGTRRLFAIDLRTSGVKVADGGWVARGLAEVPSGPIELTDCPAVPVGPDGWYLTRPGFAWGGIGVAACWYGGAVGLARKLRQALTVREPDQIATMQLGAVDIALVAARAMLGAAAAAVDDGKATGADGVLLALRVRSVVARAAEEVLERVGHALGPAPLAMDERHARRVADLQLYLRQHHAERDESALGRQVLDLQDWL
jgi:alkylation response protein AidB-like acyl-CoA dehydrogenase